MKAIFLKPVLLISCLFLITSCQKADIGGLVDSSDVDTRFAESAPLPGKPDLPFAETDFSFIVISDIHIESGPSPNLAKLKEKLISSDKFILACGDTVQAGAAGDYQIFCDQMSEIGLQYYTAIGNHDIYFDGWRNYKAKLGRSCYSVKVGPARLISLDSANGTMGRKQKNWLENALRAKTESLGFVFTHFEFFSPNLLTVQQYTDIEEVYYLMDQFERNGIDYVFYGHSHDYETHTVNGVRYVNVADFQPGGGKSFIRVHVNGGNITHERVYL